MRRSSVSNTARIDHLLAEQAITLHDGDLTDSAALVRIIGTVQPDDFVLATGEQHTVRDFAARAFRANGITLRWTGEDINEKALDAATGKTVIRVNPKWFRPADVGSLLGDPTKAKTVLGWDPQKTSYTELVRIMAEHDRALARREAMQRGR